MQSEKKVSTKFDPVNCNYTTWSPDSCGCTITLEWDKSTADKPELREHRPVDPSVTIISSTGGEPLRHNIKCKDHKHHGSIEEHHNAVLEENQRKNRAHGVLNNAETPIEWTWEGESPNRILHIKGEPAGHGDKKTVESIINKELSKHGHGKVILE